MDDLLGFLEIGIVLLSIIGQLLISSRKNWSKGKKYNFSISMFLVIFILNITIHILIGYAPYAPLSGVVLILLSGWALGLSVIAGVFQILTAVVVWLFMRKMGKGEN